MRTFRKLRAASLPVTIALLFFASACSGTSGDVSETDSGSPDGDASSDANASDGAATLESGSDAAQDGGSAPSGFLFGLNVSSEKGVVDPLVDYSVQRIWDDHLAWAELTPSKGVYSFDELDAWVDKWSSQGKKLEYVFGHVPTWASSNTGLLKCPPDSNDNCCSGGDGWCAPPTDDQDAYDFAFAVASRYKGKIEAYEVWNEPHNSWYWSGTVAQLAAMNQREIDAIRAADPSARIVSPSGKNDYMTSYWNAGGSKAFDVIAAHVYVGPSPAEAMETNLGNLQSLLAANSITAPIWVTEAGWGKNSSMTDPDRRAAFAARFFLHASSKGAERLYWYWWGGGWGSIWDPMGTNGCEVASGCLNAAGVAYEQVGKWLAHSTFTKPCSVKDTVWTCDLQLADGKAAEAVWSAAESCDSGVCGTIDYPVTGSFTSYVDLTGVTTPIQDRSVQIGAKPILLE